MQPRLRRIFWVGGYRIGGSCTLKGDLFVNSINLAIGLSRFDATFLRSRGFEIIDVPDGRPSSPVVQKLVTNEPWRMKTLSFEPWRDAATILVENVETDEAYVISFDLEKAKSEHLYVLGLLRGVLLLN